MRIAALCAGDSWYFRDLQRAAMQRGHAITAVSFSDLSVKIDRSIDCELLSEFDAVLVRTMPPGSLEQVVFRMDCLGQLQAAGLTVINSPRAVEIAVDKFLCTALLQRAGLPTPRTIVCQSEEQAMDAFFHLGGDVVVKPLFGGEGRGIARINDEALMVRASKMLSQLGAVCYLQEFVPHAGCDHRVLVVGHQLLAMQRCNSSDWRTNVSRGAQTSPLAMNDSLADLARRAAAAVDAEIAGVDILPTLDGRQLVLEVNAVPGWKALNRTLQCDVADDVIAYLERRVRQ